MSEGKIKIHPSVKMPIHLGNGFTAELIEDNTVGYKVVDQLSGESHCGVTIEEALSHFKTKENPWKI